LEKECLNTYEYSKNEVYTKHLTNPTKRVPWVPFVGVHGGYLIGSGADEYLKSSDKIVEGISAAIQRYRPDGIPVAFDLQIEAEALGCGLIWSKNSPPSVSTHPLESATSIDSLKVPSEKDGRIPIIMDALKRLKEKYTDVAFYGLVTGPLTLAMHLAGTDLLMNMLLDPESVEKIISFSRDVAIKMSQYYSKNGADFIAIVDPTVSLISPQTFDQFLTEPYKKIFEFIKSENKISASFVCGDARKVIEPICKTYPNSFHADENVPLALLRDTTQKYNISLKHPLFRHSGLRAGIALKLTCKHFMNAHILIPIWSAFQQRLTCQSTLNLYLTFVVTFMHILSHFIIYLLTL